MSYTNSSITCIKISTKNFISLRDKLEYVLFGMQLNSGFNDIFHCDCSWYNYSRKIFFASLFLLCAILRMNLFSS